MHNHSLFKIEYQIPADFLASVSKNLKAGEEQLVWTPLRIRATRSLLSRKARPPYFLFKENQASVEEGIIEQEGTPGLPRYFKELWRGEQEELNKIRAEKGLPPVHLGEATQMHSSQAGRFPSFVTKGIPSDSTVSQTISSQKTRRSKSSVEPQARAESSPDPAYDWSLQARPNQRLPEGQSWRTWLILAGRGFGKTRTGAETVRQLVDSGQYRRIAIIGKTLEEVRSVMVEGASGLLEIYAPNDPNRPTFDFRARRIKWPNGAIAELFDADRPDRLRGPQFDLAWVDELAKFRRPESFFNQLSFTLRLGQNPRCIITTTPRSSAFLQKLAAAPTTVVTRGSTFDNAANLPESFLETVRERFAGTRIGRQEIYAEVLGEQAQALWRRSLIVHRRPEVPLSRIVIAIDPAMTERGDETGIIVAGRVDDRAFILQDASGHYSPMEWAQVVARLCREYENATVVAEVNQGGDLVEAMLRTVAPNVRYKAVHASRGKVLRAEPIVALYEQKRVFHAREFGQLEFQMCSFEGNGHFCEAATEPEKDSLSSTSWDAPEPAVFPTEPPIGFWFYTCGDDHEDGGDPYVTKFYVPTYQKLKYKLQLTRKGAFIGLGPAEGEDEETPSPSSLTTFDFGEDFEEHPSPDRMDALVWALTELFHLDCSSQGRNEDEEGIRITSI